MPIVQIHLMDGRTINQKRKLVESVTNSICNALDIAPEKVRIILTEMSLEDYSIAGKLKADEEK